MSGLRFKIFRLGIFVAAAAGVCIAHVWAAEPDLSAAGLGGDIPIEQSQGISLLSRNPLHLNISIVGGYDTNVSTTEQQGKASAFAEGDVTLAGKFGTARANTIIDSGLQLLYYTNGVSGSNPEVNTHGAITEVYSVSSRLTLTGHFSAAYQAEPDFSANIGPEQRVGYFFTTADDISAAFQWFGPLSTVTSGNVVVVRYDDSTIALDQDRIDGTIGEQVKWALARGALVGEYRFEIVDYDHNATRNSTSHYALGGIDYPFNDRLNVTLRGGTTFRFFDDGSERTVPHAEGTLNYLIGRTSAVSCNVSYGLEEPDTPIFMSRTTFRGGLEFKYWLTSHVLSTFTGYYTNSHNNSTTGAVVNGSSNEESYNASVGLQYSFTSRWGVHASFDYSGTSSGAAIRDYSRERYSGGVVVNF
jgi:Putative beta-barrel porin 2